MTDEELEKALPYIRWRTSVGMSRMGCQLKYLACRYCIARKGLHAKDIETECFETEEEFQEHLKSEHRK